MSGVLALRQMRPGLLVSFLFHIVLLFWLAVVLAFHRSAVVQDDSPPQTVVDLLPPPPPPPPPTDVKPPLFAPILIPRIAGVSTNVPDIPLPPVLADRHPLVPVVVTPERPIVVQPKVLSRKNPAYPDRALDNDITGYVDIEGTVAPDGSFGDGQIVAEVPSGYGFANALLKVIPKWKFEPKTVNGTAVPYRIRYRFSFALTP